MKKIFIILAMVLCLSEAAYAGTAQTLMGLGMPAELANGIANLTLQAANNTFVKADNAAGTSSVNVWKVDGSDNTVINAKTGKVGYLDYNEGAVAGWDTSGIALPAGYTVKLAAWVPTMAATPVAATNYFKAGLNVVPTAAANTVSILPTPRGIGEWVEIVNDAGAAVRVHTPFDGTLGINGVTGATGYYVAVATKAVLDCFATSTSNYYCGSKTVPTPVAGS
jgi:hypothetical protein